MLAHWWLWVFRCWGFPGSEVSCSLGSLVPTRALSRRISSLYLSNAQIQ